LVDSGEKNTEPVTKDLSTEVSTDTKNLLEVHILSIPSGATVYKTDIHNDKIMMGKTPFLMSLQMSELKFLEIEMKEYQSQKILPSLSNSTFELTLEKSKEPTKKKKSSRRTRKEKTPSPEGSKSESKNKRPQESSGTNATPKKSAGELKDPWE
jgi:hypothetical protein